MTTFMPFATASVAVTVPAVLVIPVMLIPAGTLVAMPVAVQLVTSVVVPLNDTTLVPWLAPNPDPVIVTEPLTSNEVWSAFAPGELRVFVDGAPLAQR